MNASPLTVLDLERFNLLLETAVHAAEAMDRQLAIHTFAVLAAQVRTSCQLQEVLSVLRIVVQSDEAPLVRQQAVHALAELGHHNSAEALVVARDTDPDAEVRSSANDLLKCFPAHVQRGAEVIVIGRRILESRLGDPLDDATHRPYRFLSKESCVRCGNVAPIVPQGEEPWCFSCHGYVVLDCGAHVLSVFAASCSGAHDPVTHCAMCEDGSGPHAPNHSHVEGELN